MKPRACKPPALERDVAPTATARQQPLPLESPASRVPPGSPASRLPTLPVTEKLWFCLWLPRLAMEAVVRQGREPAAVVEEQQGVPRILLAGLACGKPNAIVTIHLAKAAPKMTRLDAAPLRKRAQAW